MNIYEKACAALKSALTTEELIALGDRMDGDSGNGLLDLLNEHLAEVAPKVFAAAAAAALAAVGSEYE